MGTTSYSQFFGQIQYLHTRIIYCSNISSSVSQLPFTSESDLLLHQLVKQIYRQSTGRISNQVNKIQTKHKVTEQQFTIRFLLCHNWVTWGPTFSLQSLLSASILVHSRILILIQSPILLSLHSSSSRGTRIEQLHRSGTITRNFPQTTHQSKTD